MAEPIEEGGKSKKKLIIILALAVLLGLGGAGGYFFFFMKEDVVETVKLPDKATYTKVRSASRAMFVVTLNTERGYRLMRVYVEAKTRDQKSLEVLTLHMPLVVSALNDLFSSQKFEEVNQFEFKEKMRVDAKKVVNKILQDKDSSALVHEVLITDLVIQ